MKALHTGRNPWDPRSVERRVYLLQALRYLIGIFLHLELGGPNALVRLVRHTDAIDEVKMLRRLARARQVNGGKFRVVCPRSTSAN